MSEKFTCIEQLFDEKICFDAKALLLSFEAYPGRIEIVSALEYISRVEEWPRKITGTGRIVSSESDE